MNDCIIFYHTATTFKGPGFYPGYQFVYLRPSSSSKSLSSRRLGMNMQYTIKTKDIQNKGEGKGLMDNAASELMAISM